MSTRLLEQKFHKGDLNDRSEFLTVLEIGKSKVKVLADSVSSEGHLIGHRLFSLSHHIKK